MENIETNTRFNMALKTMDSSKKASSMKSSINFIPRNTQALSFREALGSRMGYEVEAGVATVKKT